MDLSKIRLNEKQYDAVVTLDGPLLIIAGAGSGKTGVITHRIANMLNHGIHQSNILALTFTNKAAKEMSERVKSITGQKLTNLTISTFHAFGVQILRDHITALGYRNNFTIYDQSDKQSLMKETGRHLKMTIDGSELYELDNIFSSIKTRRTELIKVHPENLKLYHEYNEHLKLYNAVDFDDLIVRPIEIFENNPDILEAYQNKYKYIMVDEFQDTSMVQFHFIDLIAQKNRNICVVGDDDQSIYSWRGANYENILTFEKKYPELKEIKLEQNYRSTGIILSAANAVIINNTNRKEKELWTGSDGGHSIEIFYPEDDKAEGEFIAETIKNMAVKEGLTYDETGILVRTNSLTKSIEMALLANNIPYRVSGGTSFFQRKEIRDIISYLRIMSNPDDDVSLLRVINTPRRGIGKTTLQSIVDIAYRKKCSLFSSITQQVYSYDSPLNDSARAGLGEFVELIEEYQDLFAKGRKLADTLKDFMETLDYWGYLLLENPKSDKAARWKYQNVQTFAGFLEDWEKDPDNLAPNLSAFLNRITLITRDNVTNKDDTGKVNLMTIHASKGLEFDAVFLAGVEENIIPHAKSVEENPKNMEEERRLFYVAITRARKKLILTACRKRRHLKETLSPAPSPFIAEIPETLLEYSEEEDPVSAEDAHSLFDNIRKQFS